MDTKVEECEINLAIAKLLKAELEQHDYRVLMTREEDKALAHTKNGICKRGAGHDRAERGGSGAEHPPKQQPGPQRQRRDGAIL